MDGLWKLGSWNIRRHQHISRRISKSKSPLANLMQVGCYKYLWIRFFWGAYNRTNLSGARQTKKELHRRPSSIQCLNSDVWMLLVQTSVYSSAPMFELQCMFRSNIRTFKHWSADLRAAIFDELVRLYAPVFLYNF